MNNLPETLIVKSANPDFCGTWKKSDIEAEMKEFDYSGNWLEYVLEHVFDNDLDSDIEKVMVANTIRGEFFTQVGSAKTTLILK